MFFLGKLLSAAFNAVGKLTYYFSRGADAAKNEPAFGCRVASPARETSAAAADAEAARVAAAEGRLHFVLERADLASLAKFTPRVQRYQRLSRQSIFHTSFFNIVVIRIPVCLPCLV